MVIKITQLESGRAETHQGMLGSKAHLALHHPPTPLPPSPAPLPRVARTQQAGPCRRCSARKSLTLPRLICFPHQQPAPTSGGGAKGGNGVPASDLYNLLAALVKGLGAKRLKLMATVSFMH